MLAGGLTGVFTWSISIPFDVIKNLMQVGYVMQLKCVFDLDVLRRVSELLFNDASKAKIISARMRLKNNSV